jgi:hypothetical protein
VIENVKVIDLATREDERPYLTVIASHTYKRENPDETRIPPDAFGDVWTVKGK